MQQISAVIFDMGGVLVYDTDRTGFEKISKLLKVDYESVKVAAEKAIPDLQTGKISEKEFLRIVASELGKSGASDKLGNIWVKHHAEYVRRNEEVFSIAKRLRIAEYMTPILSNTEEGHVKTNRSLGLYDDFSPLILSCEVGARKPEKRIYEIALERIGFPAERCVFIDDREEFLPPAKKLGIHTIHFKNAVQLEADLRKLGIRL